MNGRQHLRRLAAVAVAAAAAAASAGELPSSLELGLEATVEHSAYLHPGTPRSRTLARLEAHALWAPVAWGEAETSVIVKRDGDGEIDRGVTPDWRETAPAPRALEVRELKLVVHAAAADLAFGKLTAAWGVADLLQPTDAVTPRDLTDPLLDTRLGAWGAQADLFPGNLDLTLLAVRHAPLRLPATDRRWFPLARISHRHAAAACDAPVLATFSRLRVLDGLPSPTPRPSGRKRHHHWRLPRFASRGGEICGLATPAPLRLSQDLPHGGGAWVAALRLAGSGRGFDWTAVARHGPDLAPHLAAAAGLDARLAYPDMTLLGGSVAAVRGPLVLRAEAAWRRYDRGGGSRPDEDFATLIAGIERRFPALLFGLDTTLIAELVHEHHTGGPHLPRELAVLDPVRLFRAGLSLRLLLHNPTGWEAEAGVVADLDAGGGLLQLLVRRNVSDTLDLELAADLLTAAGNPSLAPLAANDRVTTRLIVRF